LYLWEIGQEQPLSPSFSDLRESCCSAPESLRRGGVYLWRIVSRGRFGDERGPIWCFRLLPAAADR
jgi:hypothetical protein